MARTAQRPLRADGEESRRRILDAAAELAGERGFEGTTIAAISERSGLPKSSIYWFFEDKDDLITSVVDDSYRQWIDGIKAATTPEDHRQMGEGFTTSVAVITESPDFLRLGLMLTLDQRSEPIPARQRFVEIRSEVRGNLERLYRNTFEGLSDTDIAALAHLTLALTDGFFIAHQAGELTLADHHQLVSDTVAAAAERLGASPTGA